MKQEPMSPPIAKLIEKQAKALADLSAQGPARCRKRLRYGIRCVLERKHAPGHIHQGREVITRGSNRTERPIRWSDASGKPVVIPESADLRAPGAP